MKIDFKDLGTMNVPKYCRKIMQKEGYPKTLKIYRGDMHCLDVDVEGAAKLLLVENSKKGPVHELYVPMSEEKRAALRLKGVGKRLALPQGDV